MSSVTATMFRPGLLRATPLRAIRAQQRALHMKPTNRMMRPNPAEEQRAHTISQRLRTLKKIPVELIPLGVVLGVAIAAAAYSIVRKFYTDRTLRLSRRGSDE